MDNTFATPYLLRPIKHGADIVVHSATKFIGGHGTTLGGVIVDGGTFDWSQRGAYPAISEPNQSYHGISFTEAFLLLQGTETLSLRVQRHVENAEAVVAYLVQRPEVKRVNHPSLPDHPDHETYRSLFPRGGASIFTFEIRGGKEDAWRFIDNLQLFSLLANVADVKSLAIHPARTTHSQLSEEELREVAITPSTIRLSIGAEHIDDIIADLDRAFESLKSN